MPGDVVEEDFGPLVFGGGEIGRCGKPDGEIGTPADVGHRAHEPQHAENGEQLPLFQGDGRPKALEDDVEEQPGDKWNVDDDGQLRVHQPPHPAPLYFGDGVVEGDGDGQRPEHQCPQGDVGCDFLHSAHGSPGRPEEW